MVDTQRNTTAYGVLVIAFEGSWVKILEQEEIIDIIIANHSSFTVLAPKLTQSASPNPSQIIVECIEILKGSELEIFIQATYLLVAKFHCICVFILRLVWHRELTLMGQPNISLVRLYFPSVPAVLCTQRSCP
jgi:hypothetical protein